MICADCALFGNHKDHEFMKMKEYRQNIRELINNFENDIVAFDESIFNKKLLEKKINLTIWEK